MSWPAPRPTGRRLRRASPAYAPGVDCVIVGGTESRASRAQSRPRSAAGPLELDRQAGDPARPSRGLGADWQGLV
ncbi:MAG: hypothetical protein MZV65_25835 [Chromatiales bacterium]|nr:hypothetical protein [Chromatiales bacterium]